MLLTPGNIRISRKVKMEWCRHLNNIERGGLGEFGNVCVFQGTCAGILLRRLDGKCFPPAVDLSIKEQRRAGAGFDSERLFRAYKHQQITQSALHTRGGCP